MKAGWLTRVTNDLMGADFASVKQNSRVGNSRASAEPPQHLRNTSQYPLKPSPQQERMLDRVLMLCRQVDNAAISERREA